MSIPKDYAERVYAGVLGKIIGVYLGRPFEQWLYKDIINKLGEIRGYVNEQLKHPIVITDDDISGTFTFLRALEDHGTSRDLTAEQIGNTWLNYLIEHRTVLWWGGMGNSTEHTAWLRLASGIPAPRSGSIGLNSKVVAEQIGAQIFIDGWAMIAPGDPELAAAFARKAGSVSHDGEAVHGAVMVAAMEAQAFVESDIDALIDTGLKYIPADSLIAKMVADIRGWVKADGNWRTTRERIEAEYGYAKYGGNCHMIPNHALIHLALLYGRGDFRESLMIVNTSGWDTDCNSANVGCILGIRGGLAGIDGSGYDWRGPVADKLYIPTADGGRTVSDAVRETTVIVNHGRLLAGEEPVFPKDGARFHFSLPGSVQGFKPEGDTTRLINEAARLAIRWQGGGAAAFTETFLSPEAAKIQGYSVVASPALSPGQVVRARITGDAANAKALSVRLGVRAYTMNDESRNLQSPDRRLAPGETIDLEWTVPDLGGWPAYAVGVVANAPGEAAVHLDRLDWTGVPTVNLRKPSAPGRTWHKAWVNGADQFEIDGILDYRLIQNRGRGLAIHGCREWTDYRVSATVVPHLCEAGGIAARVQGLRRYIALLLMPGNRIQLIRMQDTERLLAEAPFEWEHDGTYALGLEVTGDRIRAGVNGAPLFDVRDPGTVLTGGGIALVAQVGRVHFGDVKLGPIG